MRNVIYRAACTSAIAGLFLSVATVAGLMQSMTGHTPWHQRMLGETPAITKLANPDTIVNPHRYETERWEPPTYAVKPRQYRIAVPEDEAHEYDNLITKLTLHHGDRINNARSRITPHMTGHRLLSIHATAPADEALKRLDAIPRAETKARYQWAKDIPRQPVSNAPSRLMPVDVYIEETQDPVMSPKEIASNTAIAVLAILMMATGVVVGLRTEQKQDDQATRQTRVGEASA